MSMRRGLLACAFASVVVGTIAACTGDGSVLGGDTSIQDAGPSSKADAFVPPAHEAGTPLPSGALDPTFGDGGLATLGSNIKSSESAGSVFRQADGKLLVVGYTWETGGTFIARLTTNGVLDPTFGTGGLVVVGGDTATSAALQADGKILVGRFKSLVRLNPDGSVDQTFGTGGSVGLAPSMTADAIRTQPDGKILVAGWRDAGLALARFTAAGVLDTTFDGDGYAAATALGASSRGYSIAIDAMGRIVVGGEITFNAIAVARFLSTGALDESFGTFGHVTFTHADGVAGSRVAIQNDGKIVVVGQVGPNCVVFRLSGTDGSLETGFGAGNGAGADAGAAPGIVVGPLCNAGGPGGDAVDVALRGDGKILVSTFNGWFQVLSDGTMDSAFGTSGVATHYLKLPRTGFQRATLILPDGSLVGAGAIDMFSSITEPSGSVWKASATGAIDTTFGNMGQTSFTLYARNDEIKTIDVLADDSIRVVGRGLRLVGLAGFSKDGTFDPMKFGWNYISGPETVAGMQRDMNGKMFVATGQTVHALNPNGSNDDAFSDPYGAAVYPPSPLGYFGAVAIGLDTMGRPIVAGQSGISGPGSQAGSLVVARLTTAGKQDTTFGTATDNPALTAYVRADTIASAMLVQAEGKTLVGGSTADGKAYVLRLDANGVLDASFAGGYVTYANVPGVVAMALQGDGKILIAGGTTIARIDASGAIDPSFGQSGVSTAASATDITVTALRIRSDGKLFLAGWKTVNAKTSMAFAQLSSTGALEKSQTLGLAAETRALDVGFQSNGAVLLGGYIVEPLTDHDFAVARFLP